MNNIIKIIKEQGEEFKKTKFVLEGSWWSECCDYDEMYIGLKSHINQTLIAIFEAEVERARSNLLSPSEYSLVIYPNKGKQIQLDNDTLEFVLQSQITHLEEVIKYLKDL